MNFSDLATILNSEGLKSANKLLVNHTVKILTTTRTHPLSMLGEGDGSSGHSNPSIVEF